MVKDLISIIVPVYNGEKEKAAGMLKSRNDQTDTTPWETSFRDANFDLIVRLFSNDGNSFR